MFRLAAICSTLVLLATPALPDAHAGKMGYALSADGTRLTVLDNLTAPGGARSVPLTTPVRSIAWRPVTGQLLGYADGRIVTIDPMTGATTDHAAVFMGDAMIDVDAVVAFDFNNKIDAVRAVGSTGENLVYFPPDFGDARAGSVRRFSDLHYAEGDMSAGAEPVIFANAYTNAIPGATAGGTFQYALDAGADALVSLANNAGTLETIAPLTVEGAPVDILPVGGFDIVSPREGSDAAYAVLQIDGQDSAGVYAIDVKTGAATLLADLGVADVSSFAVSAAM